MLLRECHVDGSMCAGVCEDCRRSPQETISRLLGKVHKTETRLQQTHLVCVSCSGVAPGEPVECESLDCPWLFERKKFEQRAESLNQITELVDELIETGSSGIDVHHRAREEVDVSS